MLVRDLAPWLIGAVTLAIAASNTSVGLGFRIIVALPFSDLGWLSKSQYESFAINGHVIELPPPYGMPNG